MSLISTAGHRHNRSWMSGAKSDKVLRAVFQRMGRKPLAAERFPCPPFYDSGFCNPVRVSERTLEEARVLFASYDLQDHRLGFYVLVLAGEITIAAQDRSFMFGSDRISSGW